AGGAAGRGGGGDEAGGDVAPTVVGEVAGERERDRQERAAAGRLQRPGGDQPLEARGRAAGEGGEHEEQHAGGEDAPTAAQVGQAPDDRQRDRVAEQVAGHDPGGVLQPGERYPKLLHDRRQQRRDDRLVERAQEDAQRGRGQAD